MSYNNNKNNYLGYEFNEDNISKNLSENIENSIIKNHIILKSEKDNKFNKICSKYKKFKKLNTKEIKNVEINNKDDKNSYYIKNNKIEKIKNNNLVDNLNKYEGETRLSVFDIQDLVNSKNSGSNKKNIPSIKSISVSNLKSFLNSNLKLKSKRKHLKTRHKKNNSIKIDFNEKSNKINHYKKQSLNLIINGIKEVDKIKNKIKNNNLKFKNNINETKWNSLKNLELNKEKIKKLKLKLKIKNQIQNNIN